MTKTRQPRRTYTGEWRDALLETVTGAKRVGKTRKTMDRIFRYVAGDPSRGIKGRRYLIYDVNQEFGDYDMGDRHISIRAIKPHQIRAFSMQPNPEVVRVLPINPDGTEMTLDQMAGLLDYILQNYRNGGLLIEDLTRYASDSYSRDVIGRICTQRQAGVDITMHFQLIGKSGHPKILPNINFMRLHWYKGSVKRHSEKFEEQIQPLLICEYLIKNEYKKGNRRFFCYYNLDESKVTGNFGKEQFMMAIDDYISDNHKQTIQPMLERRDFEGNKKYTHESARLELRKQLFEDYYGNGK